jgi:hypothetical protein
MYIYIYIYTQMHTYIYKYIYKYTHINTHVPLPVTPLGVDPIGENPFTPVDPKGEDIPSLLIPIGTFIEGIIRGDVPLGMGVDPCDDDDVYLE